MFILIILLCALFSTSAHGQIRWVADFAPSSYFLNEAVTLTQSEVVVVGGIRDHPAGQEIDGFIQVLDIADGNEVSFSRVRLSANTIFRDVVDTGGGTLGLCGQLSSIEADGVVAKTILTGEIVWSRLAPAPTVRDATTLLLASDSTLIATVPWQDLVHPLGTQIYFMRYDLNGESLDTARTPYVYGRAYPYRGCRACIAESLRVRWGY